VAFAPDGKTVATGGFQEVKLWDAATGKERFTLRLENEGAYTLAFSPDGKTLAAACRKEGVRLWDAATGKEVAPLQGKFTHAYAAAFAPDGNTLATADGAKVRLWDTGTRKERTSLAVGASAQAWRSVRMARPWPRGITPGW
jgi:WD40 repeat protein